LNDLGDDFLGGLKDGGLFFFKGKAFGDEIGAGGNASGGGVDGYDGDDQTVGGQVLAVPEDDLAHIADPFAVHEDAAHFDGVQEVGAVGIEAEAIAVGGQQQVVVVQADVLAQAGMFDEMAQFAVDGNEVPGFGQLKEELQFFLGGMAGDVDVGHFLVDHFGPQAIEVVDDGADGPLVAGNELGGKDDQIAFFDADLFVGVQGDAGQGAHGFPLGAGGDDDDLLIGQAFQVAGGHFLFGRDVEIAQLPGNTDSGDHAAAVEEDFSALGGGNVYDLLKAGDV